MKTVKEIAADCGIPDDDRLGILASVVEKSLATGHPPGLDDEFEIIGALYRRIEALELSKDVRWMEEFRKFRVAVRQALFECGVMSNPGSDDSDLTTAIVELGKRIKELEGTNN